MRVLHLDFETYCDIDLTKVGVYKYMRHPSIEIMMSQYAVDDGPVIVHDWTELGLKSFSSAAELRTLLLNPDVTIEAFNANFERLALEYAWGLKLPPERFRCTMVKAYSMGFFGSMGQVGAQMGIDASVLKLDTGTNLIRKFCMPSPKNHKVQRYDRLNSPEHWADFLAYGKQDVIAERAISNLLAPYPMREHEHRLYNLDQRINDYGVLIDIEAAEGATLIDAEEKLELRARAATLTGLANPNSRNQLLPWLAAHGHDLPDLTAQTIEGVILGIENADDPSDSDAIVLEALRMKAKIGKTSVSKYKKFLAVADSRDQRFRGALQFYGAQRTGRWAARLVQLHNLARPIIKNPETKAWLLQLADRQMVHDLHGDVTDYLVSCIRCVIIAGKGKVLVKSDFASVESRFVAWMSGCVRMNELFLAGKDSYKDFASVLYNVEYDEVTKEQRGWCKPPVLGCAYQLGAGNEKTGDGGLMAYAKGMGVIMTYAESKAAVDTFREMHPEIVAMWYWLVEACTDVIVHGGERAGYAVTITRDNNFMFIQLPSGRKLSYYKPRMEMRIPPWEMNLEPVERIVTNPVTGEAQTIWVKPKPKLKETITYMGKSKEGNKWVRLSTHGGKIAENICQAGCMDLLGDAMLDLDAETPYPICLHVHDEPVQEVDERYADEHLIRMNEILCRPRAWAPGLVMDAEGEVTRRFTK